MSGDPMSEPEPKPEAPKPTNAVAMVIATGLVVLHTRRYRRNLLFGLTLALLLVVFAGAVPLGAWLMKRPMGFTFFWGFCFLLLLAVLVLALYDLMRVRRAHHREMRKLDERLHEAISEARERAEADIGEDRPGSDSDGEEKPS